MPTSKRNHYSEEFKDNAVKRTLALSKKTEDNEIHALKLRLEDLKTENEGLRKECAILKQTASFYFSQ